MSEKDDLDALLRGCSPEELRYLERKYVRPCERRRDEPGPHVGDILSNLAEMMGAEDPGTLFDTETLPSSSSMPPLSLFTNFTAYQKAGGKKP